MEKATTFLGFVSVVLQGIAFGIGFQLAAVIFHLIGTLFH